MPRTGWRHLRGHAALKDTSLWKMARAVLRSHTSFAAWLRSAADTLQRETPAAVAATGWEAPPLLPLWGTDEAAELVRAAILAAEPTTVADDPVIHAAVVRIRASAYRAALYREAMQADGVPTAMPFFDRHVAEACLSVLPWERTDPWCPKPLLHAAFREVIPTAALSRRTKGEYNADIHHGWSIHHRQVAELLDCSRLAEDGLVAPTTLRAALAAFGPSRLPPVWITDLVAVETWLRHLAPPFSAARRPTMRLPLWGRRTRTGTRLLPTVVTAPVDDGLNLLDKRRGILYHLNHTGALILATLIDGGTVESAVTILVDRYAVGEDQARADVIALVENLHVRELVTSR